MDTEKFLGLGQLLQDKWAAKHLPGTVRVLQSLVKENREDALEEILKWLEAADGGFWKIRWLNPERDEEFAEMLVGIGEKILATVEDSRKYLQDMLSPN